MKIILIEDVDNIGKRGDIKNVANGYARNYLIPRHLAVRATPMAIKRSEMERRTVKSKEERVSSKEEEILQELQKNPLVIKARAGDTGKLYGAVTNLKISEEIKDQFGITVDKKNILLNKPIKEPGKYEIGVKLSQGVEGEITVDVQSEGNTDSKE